MTSEAETDALDPRHAVGVVLAGGGSTRMGTSKAALPIGGEPLVRRVVCRLAAALPRVVVIGPLELAALVPDVLVLPDVAPGVGPLGGLATALWTVNARQIFAVACDMPFVSPPLIRAMVTLARGDASVDVVALRTARGTEYLHAVYARSCLPMIQRQLDSGDLALRHLLDRLHVRTVDVAEAAAYDPAGLSAFNANTPGEWERALQLAQNTPFPPDTPLDR